MSVVLDKLIDSTPYLWKGNRPGHTSLAHISTGFESLDEALPGSGWPLGSVIELLPLSAGIGEVRLMLPAIRLLTQKRLNVLMINTPHCPYAPALTRAGIDLNYLLIVTSIRQRDALWTAEKALRNRACGMVMLWPNSLRGPSSIKEQMIRRLQVAAQTGASILILYRSCSPNHPRALFNQSSWAAIRLKLDATGKDALKIDIIRALGAFKHSCLRIKLIEAEFQHT